MKTTHTPGPWTCSPQPETGIDITIRSDNYAPRPYVASITWGNSDLFREQNIGNARLIAAAPDLLSAACEVEAAMLNVAHQLDPALKATVDKLYRAIAKAEGRQ